MADEGFHERFVAANANVESMASQMAELLRSVMRAAASSDRASQTYRAAETFIFLLELIQNAKDFNTVELLARAIDEISIEPHPKLLDESVVHAAKMGMRFLVELSCRDNAASARASKRETEFLQAIEDIETARGAIGRNHRFNR